VNWERLSQRLVPAPVTPLKAVGEAGDARNFDRYSETDDVGAPAASAPAGDDDPFADF
jgi:hypothetical protein